LEPELSASSWWHPGWTAQVIAEAPSAFDRACQRWRDLYLLAAAEKDAAHALNSDTTASPKAREEARRRYQEASRRVELLLNESDSAGQSDFYTYRYLASEGFLPGYSFPRLPLSAFIPGSRGKDSSWLQRARFLAISEFGPGALIYHEGSSYQVTRIALPRRGDSETPGEVVRSEASVCDACGYHHPRQAGLDVCQNCRAPLTSTWKSMLQLQQVITRPRQRISADEEERNRIGFELRTTYRFTGEQALDAQVIGASAQPVADVTYGDAAEIRVTNLGRRVRANKDVLGFNLDLIKGRWLPDADPGEDDPPEESEAELADVKAKARVMPYVEDRRNIAILRWSQPLPEDAAVTAQYAIERGIEATFQLEDSELATELLPDADARGRILLIEAAEGGAGVLRRLQGEPDALARVATQALRIMHVDPDTGQDEPDACVRGCYRCLLTYGNQLAHESIDRRAVVALLREVAAGRTQTPVATDRTLTPQPGQPASLLAAPGSPAEVLITLLAQRHLLMPSALESAIEGTIVDAVYADKRAVVVFGASPHEPRDTFPLLMANWNVITVPVGADLNVIIEGNPSVFVEVAQ
jgi:hypothetical protein